MAVDAGMKTFVRVMKALSDPNRVKILKLLQHRELCVCELRSALDISQPSVSKHLKILEDAGLVNSSRDGLWVNYRLSAGALNPYGSALLGNLRHWLDNDPEVAALTSRLPDLDRRTICGS
jgi:ArsR family transcriptional regulator